MQSSCIRKNSLRQCKADIPELKSNTWQVVPHHQTYLRKRWRHHDVILQSIWTKNIEMRNDRTHDDINDECASHAMRMPCEVDMDLLSYNTCEFCSTYLCSVRANNSRIIEQVQYRKSDTLEVNLLLVGMRLWDNQVKQDVCHRTAKVKVDSR